MGYSYPLLVVEGAGHQTADYVLLEYGDGPLQSLFIRKSDWRKCFAGCSRRAPPTTKMAVLGYYAGSPRYS